MRKKWFYRLLLSYLPVFFVMISVLVIIVYLDINQGSKRQLHATNEVIARQSLELLDSSLSSIENSVIRELVNDPVFQIFYTNKSNSFSAYDLYLLTEKLVEIKRAMPLIDSIYLYNETRQEVLTSAGIIPIGNFYDKDFIAAMYPVGNTKWSNPRKFNAVSTANTTDDHYVVSLVKSAPLTSPKEGLAIVNIRIDAINHILDELSRSDYSFLRLLDSNGRSFSNYDEETLSNSNDGLLSTQLQSSYSKWYMKVGLKDDHFNASYFMMMNLWMYIGGGIILIGLAWLSFVTHRNYKPISRIVDGIRQYSSGRTISQSSPTRGDEISLIQSTLDNLMLESSQMDQQLRENLSIKRKHELMEVIEGVKPFVSIAGWKAKLQELELPATLMAPTLVVVEIDGYIDFDTTYSVHDQYLLKYAVKKVLEEVCQSKNVPCWMEWMESNRMVVLLQGEVPGAENEELFIYELCEIVRKWVQEHLGFTISLGIGPRAASAGDIPYSYQEAAQTLQYKATFGKNRTIRYREAASTPSNGIYEYLGRFRELSAKIKLGEPGWRDDVNELFLEMAGESYTQNEVSNILHYFNYQLQKEMMELGELFQHYWKEEIMPKLGLLIDRAETVREAGEHLLIILTELDNGLTALRENRNSHKTIHQIKQFIDDHYDDPNLSLEQLNEQFGMSPRYISRLFKEEYGESFIVYLSGLRVRRARQLLETTQESVQEIVEKVGYLNASAFIRIFRKATDMTPGEYRKAHAEKNASE